MTALELHQVTSRILFGIELKCDAGKWVVLGSPADGAEELVRILAGLERPRRGSARVTGLDPHRSPRIRARIGSLLNAERLPPAKSVSESVACALVSRGDGSRPEGLLERFGIGAWATRPTATLDDAEHRTLALALALAVPNPVLLILSEPLFACGPTVERSLVVRDLAAAAVAGSVVICTTSNPRDAAELGGETMVLERGRWSRLPGGDAGSRSAVRAVIRTDKPRNLAAALARDPDVVAVSFEASSALGEVCVTGSDVELLSLAIGRVARREQLPIHSIQTSRAAPFTIRGAP